MECKSDSDNAIYGGVCSKAVATCKEVYDKDLLEDGATEVMLMSPQQGRLVNAVCFVVDGEAHTSVNCDELVDTNGECMQTMMANDRDNTCVDYGYLHAPFRSKAHFQLAYNYYSMRTMMKYWRTPGAVYNDANGVRGEGVGVSGNCRPFASTSRCATDGGWKSIDGKVLIGGLGVGATRNAIVLFFLFILFARLHAACM